VNGDGTMVSTNNISFAGSLDANSAGKAVNFLDPTSNQDLVTRLFMTNRTAPQQFVFSCSVLSNTGTLQFLFPMFSSTAAPIVEANARMRVTLPSGVTGKLSRLRVDIGTAATGDVTYTLRVNSVNTAITCSVPGTGTSGTDLVNTVTVNDGDILSFGAQRTAGSSAANNIIASFMMTLS
jgi:hypothetical protein